MSFRRSREAARAHSAWERYLRENIDLLAGAGVPASVFGDARAFAYFLMHGYAPDADFCVDELTSEQQDRLAEAVSRYLAAGLGDPGLGLFGDERHHEIRKNAAAQAESGPRAA